MSRLFGTDGVRGVANGELTASLAVDLGEAAARHVLNERKMIGRKGHAVVGRDPRISGEFLDNAVCAGLAGAGMDVTRIGVVPTPTVAHVLTSERDIDLGVVISASHNSMEDNGIKFFASGGYKFGDQVENQIGALVGQSWVRPTGSAVGRIRCDYRAAHESYVNHLMEALDVDLTGLRIVVDCANGSASVLGPEVLRRAGAEVIAINASPDGVNINDSCGSTYPERLKTVTVEAEADFGVAYDGDADRCLAVDAQGKLVDGDKIMGLLAMQLKQEGKLVDNTLVVTVMSNLGLLNAMKAAGIRTVQSAVGDRYVLEAMREGGFNLGGEQSGHVIALDHSTTGDGVLTSLLVAKAVKKTGCPLSELVSGILRLPQILVNVEGVDRSGLGNEGVVEVVERVQNELGSQGRVVLRPSGTEPLVRVMVEAPTQSDADGLAQTIAVAVREHLTL